MKLTEEQYLESCNDNAGYCLLCDDITECSGIEPDAEAYTCPVCDASELMGVELALLMGWLDLGT